MLSPAQNSALAGLRVFIMEDEALVVVNLEDMLDELGCTVVGPAMRIEQAEGMIEQAYGADIAILDVNISGKPVFPIAELLAERGVPMIFATGYGRGGLPEKWQAHPILQKPYTFEDVAQCLATARAGVTN